MQTRFEGFFQDFRYGVRGLVRKPGFSSTAILILAVGIGATVAVFSVVDRLLIAKPAIPGFRPADFGRDPASDPEW